MWARAETFASLLLKLVPPAIAEPLPDVLDKITAALNEQADSLSAGVKSVIATGKQLIDGSITFEKPVYFLNVCPAKVTVDLIPFVLTLFRSPQTFLSSSPTPNPNRCYEGRSSHPIPTVAHSWS